MSKQGTQQCINSISGLESSQIIEFNKIYHLLAKCIEQGPLKDEEYLEIVNVIRQLYRKNKQLTDVQELLKRTHSSVDTIQAIGLGSFGSIFRVRLAQNVNGGQDVCFKFAFIEADPDYFKLDVNDIRRPENIEHVFAFLINFILKIHHPLLGIQVYFSFLTDSSFFVEYLKQLQKIDEKDKKPQQSKQGIPSQKGKKNNKVNISEQESIVQRLQEIYFLSKKQIESYMRVQFDQFFEHLRKLVIDDSPTKMQEYFYEIEKDYYSYRMVLRFLQTFGIKPPPSTTEIQSMYTNYFRDQQAIGSTRVQWLQDNAKTVVEVLEGFIQNNQHRLAPVNNEKALLYDAFVTSYETSQKNQQKLNDFKQQLPNSVQLVQRVLVCEYAKNKSLFDFLRERNFGITAHQWDHFIFQILFNLYAVQQVFPNFRHNDYKINNLLVKEISHQTMILPVDGISYLLQGCGYSLSMWDFDYCNIQNVLENNKVNAEWFQAQRGHQKNRFADIHFFFYSLKLCVQESIDILPPRIKKIMLAVTQAPHSYELLKIDKVQIPRYIGEQEYFLPQQLIAKYFDDFQEIEESESQVIHQRESHSENIVAAKTKLATVDDSIRQIVESGIKGKRNKK